MEQQSDNASKAFEPTQNKLNEARKKGETARSSDLNTSASYAGFLVAALLGGAASIETLGTAMSTLLDQAVPISGDIFEGSGDSYLTGILQFLLSGLAVWFLLPAGCALLSVLAQRSLVFAPSKLAPKASRISIVQNAKNKFGASGIFEFSKSFVKLLLFSILLVIYLTSRMPEMTGTLSASPGIVARFFAKILVEFLFIVVLISAAIGAVDYAWQYFDHIKRNRMTHKEIRDENKEQEGDPYLKNERRQRGTAIAKQQIATSVSTADVVIVNPTHYAVALQWSREPGTAPCCVAKGVDHTAQSIKEAAMAHDVPIRSDPPTARALYATTDIGAEIDPKHYQAVATAIRFAETMKQKARYWT